jgi:hypothetical protein
MTVKHIFAFSRLTFRNSVTIRQVAAYRFLIANLLNRYLTTINMEELLLAMVITNEKLFAVTS